MSAVTSSPPATAARLFVAGPHAELAAHIAAYGAAPPPESGSSLVGKLEESGLIGRGGAGFPAWRKLAATNDLRRRPGGAVVIANGAEGEPLSRKDATLLQHSPHLVFDGLLAVAGAVGASEVFLYATEVSMKRINAAIRDRPDMDRVKVVVAPHTFISGEASAVVNAIENNLAIPTDRTRRLSDHGLRGKPTLVFNVETLAHLALVDRYGPNWFRTVGTNSDAGTRLVTVSGSGLQPVVLEVPGAISLRSALSSAGVNVGTIQAVLVGGYHGAWVASEHLDTPLSPADLLPFGGHPGAGILAVLDNGQCGLVFAAEIATYLGAQSAKQCGPCTFGLPAMASILSRLARRERDPALVTELGRLGRLTSGRGSCHHPDGTTRFVLSTISVFADEVQLHLGGRCSAPDHRISEARQ